MGSIQHHPVRASPIIILLGQESDKLLPGYKQQADSMQFLPASPAATVREGVPSAPGEDNVLLQRLMMMNTILNSCLLPSYSFNT